MQGEPGEVEVLVEVQTRTEAEAAAEYSSQEQEPIDRPGAPSVVICVIGPLPQSLRSYRAIV